MEALAELHAAGDQRVAPSTEFPIDADDPWKPLFNVPGEPVTD